MKKQLISICMVVFTLGFAQAAFAENTFSIRGVNTWVKDRSFDVLAKGDAWMQAEITFGRTVWSPHRLVDINAEFNYVPGSQQSDLYGGTMEVEGSFHQLTIGPRATATITNFLQVYARGGLGLMLSSIRLNQSAYNATMTDRKDSATGAQGFILAGVELLFPKITRHESTPRRFTGGIIIEGGYSLTSELSYNLSPPDAGDTKMIPAAGAELGALHLSGGQLNVGFQLHF